MLTTELARNENDEQKLSDRRSHLFLVLLMSCICSLFLVRNYQVGLPEAVSFDGRLFFWWAAASSVAFWHLLLLLVHAATRFLPARWRLVTFMSLCSIFNVILMIDATIYGLYRFHINGMVWNLITTPGGGETFTIGTSAYATAALYISSIVGWIVGLSLLLRNVPLVANRQLQRKHTVIIVLGLLAFVFAEKTMQVVGDVKGTRNISRTRATTPFYLHVSMKRFLAKNFGIFPAHPEVSISESALNYPREPLVFAEDHETPNVLLMVIEGGRFDCLDEKCMPNLTAWGNRNIVAEQHRSGGNASRFGVFSALYGINATYWHTVLADRRGSVLINQLKEFGYHFGIYSSANLNFPEFRQTAFASVADSQIHDDYGANKQLADKITSKGIVSLIEGEGPWFGFAYFQASHQPYRYPEEDAVYEVNEHDINYATLGQQTTVNHDMLGQFKNSLHYVDRQLAPIFEALQSTGADKNTIVIIVGDHGEEFGELGYFGHNATFSRYQTQTFCVMAIPGIQGKRITRTTCHYDIVPTIFNYIGCQNDTEMYSHGLSMIGDEAHSYLVLATWARAAVYSDQRYLQTGYRGGNLGFALYDESWNELSESDPFSQRQPQLLQYLLEDSRLFRR
ncbi:MAG: sulfatase-like hydrolase/transferase [Planctomycetota bacterium]|nr:sulfatase-like hydrolase/transferase [Planctomycetota bacterium]